MQCCQWQPLPMTNIRRKPFENSCRTMADDSDWTEMKSRDCLGHRWRSSSDCCDRRCYFHSYCHLRHNADSLQTNHKFHFKSFLKISSKHWFLKI
jgi:hypothetical protein